MSLNPPEGGEVFLLGFFFAAAPPEPPSSSFGGSYAPTGQPFRYAAHASRMVFPLALKCARTSRSKCAGGRLSR